MVPTKVGLMVDLLVGLSVVPKVGRRVGVTVVMMGMWWVVMKVAKSVAK